MQTVDAAPPPDPPTRPLHPGEEPPMPNRSPSPTPPASLPGHAVPASVPGHAVPASVSGHAVPASAPPDPATADRKAQRRTARLARRSFLAGLNPAIRRAFEAALADQILPHLGPPGVLGTHAAVGDEIDPHVIEGAAVALGWSLAFPRVADGPLGYHLASFDMLSPGYRGIPEPAPDLPQARPDVLLVPLLAADRTGNRLGQGGGHYDRTLAAIRAAGPVLAIGIAFDMQIVDTVTAAPWDQPLDAIATPTAFHLAPARARRSA